MNVGKIVGEMLFAGGLSLIVVGATKMWTNTIGILGAGLIIYFTGTIIRVLSEK